jgi:hypothetical protein
MIATVLYAAAVLRAPVNCVAPDGTTHPLDDPSLPFFDPLPLPDCTPAPETTVASAATDAVFGIDSFRDSLTSFVKTLATFWVSTPSPDVQGDTAQFLTTSVSWYTAALMVVAMLVRGAMIALGQRGQGVGVMFASLVRYILVVGSGSAVLSALLVAGDAYSAWIIDRSTEGTDFGGRLTSWVLTPTEAGSLGQLALLLLLGLAIVVSLGQVVLLTVRGGVMVILAGTWPLSASAAALDAGKPWFSRQTAWIVAFALYKPAAATIYAASFRLIGTPAAGADPTLTILSGVSVMVVAILALPALIRLVMPATSPVSDGRGLGAAAASALSLLVAARR